MSHVFLNIVLACSLVYLCSARGNDYQWGTVGNADTLLASEVVKRNPTFLGSGTTQDFVYQQTGAATPLTIRAIRITDQKKLKGATAVISSGGVGSNAVTIRFTSNRGAGIKSLVEIYGS